MSTLCIIVLAIGGAILAHDLRVCFKRITRLQRELRELQDKVEILQNEDRS